MFQQSFVHQSFQSLGLQGPQRTPDINVYCVFSQFWNWLHIKETVTPISNFIILNLAFWKKRLFKNSACTFNFFKSFMVLSKREIDTINKVFKRTTIKCIYVKVKQYSPTLLFKSSRRFSLLSMHLMQWRSLRKFSLGRRTQKGILNLTSGMVNIFNVAKQLCTLAPLEQTRAAGTS